MNGDVMHRDSPGAVKKQNAKLLDHIQGLNVSDAM